jgi:hypothetical protein
MQECLQTMRDPWQACKMLRAVSGPRTEYTGADEIHVAGKKSL